MATADLQQNVDIVKVGQLPCGSYSPDKYGGRVAYLKNIEMKGKVTVFASGKLISVGTRSEAAAKKDFATACDVLEKAGLTRKTRLGVKVRNVVAMARVPAEIDLEIIAKKLNHIIYEPEQFPAAILRFDKYPEITALVFSSGKLIIAGAKSASSIGRIVQYVTQQLAESQLSN